MDATSSTFHTHLLGDFSPSKPGSASRFDEADLTNGNGGASSNPSEPFTFLFSGLVISSRRQYVLLCIAVFALGVLERLFSWIYGWLFLRPSTKKRKRTWKKGSTSKSISISRSTCRATSSSSCSSFSQKVKSKERRNRARNGYAMVVDAACTSPFPPSAAGGHSSRFGLLTGEPMPLLTTPSRDRNPTFQSLRSWSRLRPTTGTSKSWRKAGKVAGRAVFLFGLTVQRYLLMLVGMQMEWVVLGVLAGGVTFGQLVSEALDDRQDARFGPEMDRVDQCDGDRNCGEGAFLSDSHDEDPEEEEEAETTPPSPSSLFGKGAGLNLSKSQYCSGSTLSYGEKEAERDSLESVFVISSSLRSPLSLSSRRSRSSSDLGSESTVIFPPQPQSQSQSRSQSQSLPRRNPPRLDNVNIDVALSSPSQPAQTSASLHRRNVSSSNEQFPR